MTGVNRGGISGVGRWSGPFGNCRRLVVRGDPVIENCLSRCRVREQPVRAATTTETVGRASRVYLIEMGRAASRPP